MRSITKDIVIPDKPIFLLTVDTEEEWDWNGKLPRKPFSTENVKQIPEFQSFCEKIDVKPTYFIDHAVADNSEHIHLLKDMFDRGTCDFGAHLHPWTNPPVLEEICDKNSHALNLPLTLFENKMKVLTRKLESVFQAHPYSFRAGRWGVNSEQLRVLAELGYRVDSSVRPYYRDEFFDYSKAPNQPYWPSAEDVTKVGSNSIDLLEVPSSSGYTHSNHELLHFIYSKMSEPPFRQMRINGILWHLGLLRPVSVTPEGTNASDVCSCIDACIKRGDRVINMFLHSPDLLPGSTSYVRSESEKNEMLASIVKVVEHIKN